MNLFATSLAAAMKKEAVNQSELAERLEMTQPNIGRYLSGEALPNEKTIVKMVGVFPPESALPLCRSWVRDTLGVDIADSILAKSERAVVRDDADWLEDLPQDFRSALSGMAKMGRVHPEAREAIIKLFNLIKPR